MYDLVQASEFHVEGKFHVVLDCLVDGLQAISVLGGECWVEWSCPSELFKPWILVWGWMYLG
jgi:hypothetical protein